MSSTKKITNQVEKLTSDNYNNWIVRLDSALVGRNPDYCQILIGEERPPPNTTYSCYFLRCHSSMPR